MLVCGSPALAAAAALAPPLPRWLECKWLWLGGYPLAGKKGLLTSAWNSCVFPTHTPASLISAWQSGLGWEHSINWDTDGGGAT